MLQNGGSRSLESSFNPIENKDSTPNDVTLLGAVDYLKKIKKLEDELEASSRKEKELTLNLAQRDSKCESLSKKLAEQQKEISDLTYERDQLSQTNSTLTEKNRKLEEKIQTLESKQDGKPMSVSEFRKQIETKNTVINDLRLVIENLVEEKNYKAECQSKEEELKSSEEINRLLQAAIEKKESEIKNLKATFQMSSQGLLQEEIRGLNQKIIEMDITYKTNLELMNKEFQESRDKLANILLFKIDSLKKENEELVNQNQSQLKVFQETENALRHEISQLKHASLNVQRRDPRVPHDIHDNRLEMRDNINQIRDPRATHHLYDRAHDTRERRDNDLRDPRAVGRMQNEDDRGSRTPERIDTNEGYPYSRDNYHNNYNDNINYEFENKKRKLDSMNAREKQSNIHNYSHSRGY